MGIRHFVVQTLPCHEGIARANLANQGFEVFHPTIIIERKHPRFQRLTSSAQEPLFPGYIFVKFDPSQSQWRCINGTRGVKRVLGECESPTPVPIGVVEEIEQRWAAGAFNVAVASSLTVRAGQEARVEAGPFAGMIGTCVVARANRVKLLLNVLGGAVQVMFSPSAVVPLAA